MRSKLIALIFIMALTALFTFCHAQEKAVPNKATEPAYRYDTPGVTLEGKLMARRVYGPPGYGETPAKDSRDTILILKLVQPITTRPLADVTPKNNPNSESFEHVREVQLFLSRDRQSDSKKMIGRVVVASGQLNVRVAPADYTDVWMDVKALRLK